MTAKDKPPGARIRSGKPKPKAKPKRSGLSPAILVRLAGAPRRGRL